MRLLSIMSRDPYGSIFVPQKGKRQIERLPLLNLPKLPHFVGSPAARAIGRCLLAHAPDLSFPMKRAPV
mgnify:CR=1 FL=1